MRVMAIDWGSVRLGLAFSDPGGMIASPASPIKRKGDNLDIKEILRIISEKEISEIVLGVPLDTNGEYGKTAEKVKKFAELIERDFEGTVHLVDERYSTHAAERSLIEGNVSRKKRKQLRDGVAAAWILQGFLDGRNCGVPEFK